MPIFWLWWRPEKTFSFHVAKLLTEKSLSMKIVIVLAYEMINIPNDDVLYSDLLVKPWLQFLDSIPV